ncbi:MAG TPA: DNA-3-methyladenine glycosylase I [Candidatus Gallacutalibacter stercoravium]|nr:DNA-3-methyladenine glycosylase I [Candidatus Gallacutalibacter stercoravium]
MCERCGWCLDGGLLQRYHDEEWGVPVHDDQKHFEYLTLEVMQCGLNWKMMLQKREIFRQCFENFDYNKIAGYDKSRVQEILETDGMIRSPRKINAVIGNARAFQKIIAENGSFDRFLWRFSGNQIMVYPSHQSGLVARNALSDQVSKALKKEGFRFLGSVTVYSYLQSCGVINDHAQSCYRYAQLLKVGQVCRQEE